MELTEDAKAAAAPSCVSPHRQYAVRELLALRRHSAANRGSAAISGAPSYSAHEAAKTSGGRVSHGSPQRTDNGTDEHGLREVAALRVASRPPEAKLEAPINGRLSAGGPLGAPGTPRARTSFPGSSQQRDEDQLGNARRTDSRPHVNPCPNLEALHAARQRLVTLCKEAGPSGLPLSQVLQRHLCSFNSLLEPRALGFDDIAAFVRSAWPAVQLRAAGSPKSEKELQQPQQKQQQQEQTKQLGDEGNKQGGASTGSVARSTQPREDGQQQQNELADQEEQQQQEDAEQEGGQQLANASRFPLTASTRDHQLQQRQQQQEPSCASPTGPTSPVITYARPLLSLEAHLFSNLLFALIADAAEQHEQQQQQQQQRAADEPQTGRAEEPFQGVPFAALPRLWQEKYSALEDLRRFQAAAGVRDLCAFLERLPEVTLQRKGGELLLALAEGVIVPEGPQYIPNELRRHHAAAAASQNPRPSPALASLLQSSAVLQQRHHHATAEVDGVADVGQQHLQKQHNAWQASSQWLSSAKSNVPPFCVAGQQFSLQAAQTLLRQLQPQQQQTAAAEPQSSEGAAASQKLHRTPSLGNSRVPSQALPVQQRQQQQAIPAQQLHMQHLQRLLREAGGSLGDQAASRRLLASLGVVDGNAQQREGASGPQDSEAFEVARQVLGDTLQPAQLQQQQQQQQRTVTAGFLAELLASQGLPPYGGSGEELQRQLALSQQQQQAMQNLNANRVQLRRRLLGFVRAACKQQRLQWQRNEDLSELLLGKQLQQPESVDEGTVKLRQQLLLLLQLDGQLRLLQQQQQRTEDCSTTSTATPGGGQQQGVSSAATASAATAVRRYLLRLLASPAVAAARSRHRLRTAGAAVSAIKREWKHQYGESLTQRLQEANVSFGELVESEPHLIVLGSGRGLRLSTRQHLEEFDLLQLPADAAAPRAAAGAFPEAPPTATKAPGVLWEKQTSRQADSQWQKQQLLQLLQQAQLQHQQQAPLAQSETQLQETQSLQQQPQGQTEQTLLLLQRLLSALDSRCLQARKGSEQAPSDAASTDKLSALRNLIDHTRPAVPLKNNVHRLVYVLVAKLCQQQHAMHLLLRTQSDAPQTQLQQLQLQQHQHLLKQGKWKAAQDAKMLSENGIAGVRVSELGAEWRRFYGCDLEGPMRHAGYPDVLSLVSGVPGLFLLGEGEDARCLVALQSAWQGQLRESQLTEESQPTAKSLIPSVSGGCDRLKNFVLAKE